jgi:hypothetical protein
MKVSNLSTLCAVLCLEKVPSSVRCETFTATNINTIFCGRLCPQYDGWRHVVAETSGIFSNVTRLKVLEDCINAFIY